MKIALFKDEYSQLIWPEGMEKHTRMLRVSEYIEVDFPPRAAEEFVPAQVEAIEREIADLTTKYATALEHLKTRKADLLSITFNEVPA
jgi:hypothetical protein